MPEEVISYLEMCDRENSQLQKGMNFWQNRDHSVILMSRRVDAPYEDEWEEDGAVLIYEGHDAPNRAGEPDPKQIDQPQFTSTGRPTENGKFHEAAQSYKLGLRPARQVRVYEKIYPGIWSFNGVFELVDSWITRSGQRSVFKFRLKIVDEAIETSLAEPLDYQRTRMIPSSVKQVVWKRDGGKCRICGANENLHFDHIIPFSRGGASDTAENIQLLCAKHNLQKRDRIE